MICKTHKCPNATWKTAKPKSVWQRKCHISPFLVQTTLSNSDVLKTVKVLTVILSQNWCLSQCRALQLLGVFIATNLPWSIKLFTALPGCCPLHWTLFSNVVRMHTCGLVPKPKTTVIGLGVRLVHTWNHKLASQRTAGTVSSCSSCQGLCPAFICLFIAMLRNSLLAALVTLGWSCSCLSTVVSFHVKESELHKGRYGE